ncbi:MAG: formamidopyrimidine-DNA glycosylase [Fuerstiella sp.]|nr:formamidopyrimidine-DNA glycosylase [Fuerstiella sp.]
MVRGLRTDLVGRQIRTTRFCRCSRRPIQIDPSKARFQRLLRGNRIHAVQRLAKRIVISLDRNLSMVVEPRMTGLLLITEPPTRAHRRIQWELDPKDGFAKSFEFWDRRGLGTVRILTETKMIELRRRLGPDALDMDPNQWAIRLSGTQRPIKNAILDQNLVAGIGNIYASEILHEAGISPKLPAGLLSAERIQRIAAASSRILNEAIRYEGSTLGDGTYRTALNRDGSYQNRHRVYQKNGELCPTCRRGRICRIVQAQRSTFYCPRCQRS